MFQLLKVREDYEGFFYAHSGQYYFQDWRTLKAMVGRETIEKAEGISVLINFDTESDMLEYIDDNKWRRLTSFLYD